MVRYKPSASVYISIHAPREGGDYDYLDNAVRTNTFQSTPPARGATQLFRMGKGLQ